MSLYDPYGLWSISAGGYVVVGGQVTVYGDGLNITGVGGRGGFGVGGGGCYDPNGSPPSRNSTGSASTIGGFAEAGAS